MKNIFFCKKSIIKATLFISLAFASFACSNSSQNTLTIAHFNDLYEITPPKNSKHSRIAQASTIINELRKNNVAVMTTLGGDYLSPSTFGTVEINGKPIAGEQMVDIINTLGLDWAIFGNHEFDLSEDQFLARLSESKFHIITSNITDKNGKLFPNTQSSAVVLVQFGKRTIKVGLIGITIDSNHKPWVKYLPQIDSAKAQIAKLGDVDAIIALTHLSLQQDQDLVRAVPEINLVLGGHEHENWLIYRGPNLTPIIKSDSNLQTLAVVKLLFSPTKSRPEISTYLQPIDDRITADHVIDDKVTKWIKIASDGFEKSGFRLDRVVANLSEDLDGREAQVRNQSTNLTKLVAESLFDETKPVDVVFFNSGLIRIDDILQAGPITEYDIIRISPFKGKVIKTTITGSLLNKILDIGIKNRGTGSYLQILGATKNNNQWLIKNEVLDPNKEYSVAMNDFLLNKKEYRDIYLVKNIKEYRDIQRVLIDVISNKYPANY